MATIDLSIAVKKLTNRETDIVRELLTGAANKEISYRLGLSVGTVKVYFNKLALKLNIHSRVGIALWAERSGLFANPAEEFTRSLATLSIGIGNPDFSETPDSSPEGSTLPVLSGSPLKSSTFVSWSTIPVSALP